VVLPFVVFVIRRSTTGALPVDLCVCVECREGRETLNEMREGMMMGWLLVLCGGLGTERAGTFIEPAGTFKTTTHPPGLVLVKDTHKHNRQRHGNEEMKKRLSCPAMRKKQRSHSPLDALVLHHTTTTATHTALHSNPGCSWSSSPHALEPRRALVGSARAWRKGRPRPPDDDDG